MRAALVLAALLLLVGGISAAVAEAATSATRYQDPTPPLKVPQRLTQALVRQGYPVRHPCGSVIEPPPRIGGTHGHVVLPNDLPACWLVIYKDRYSVSITPHSSPAAARLAYQRTYNKWTRTTRRIVLGRLLVSGFRVPAQDWNAIRQVVSAIVSHA